MMYIKINPDGQNEYPYLLKNLQIEFPATSFSKNTDLKLFGVYEVNRVYPPDDYTKNYTETEPILIDKIYYQNWIALNATQEEINQRIENKWSEIRSIRNQYLLECDWTQLFDCPLAIEKKDEWITYRQQLRNITLQTDPYNIIWPTKP